MQEALKEARQAAAEGEVPVGAVLVYEGAIISRGHNLKEGLKDATAHAEMWVLRDASARLGRWRLTGCTMVVTLEPCAMCAAALVHARVDNVVFGAFDAKAGAVGSVMNIAQHPSLNHMLHVWSGVQQKECAEVLSDFFAKKRAAKKQL